MKIKSNSEHHKSNIEHRAGEIEHRTLNIIKSNIEKEGVKNMEKGKEKEKKEKKEGSTHLETKDQGRTTHNIQLSIYSYMYLQMHARTHACA